MMTVMIRVIEAFERGEIRYCIIRDGENPGQHPAGDVDFLVAPTDLPQVAAALRELGFVRAPRLGYAPHHFFAGFDDRTGAWLKLDIVTDLRYGRPIPVLFTRLGDACLQRRRRSGNVCIPSAEDELLGLLLHCILDKGRFAPRRWSRIQALHVEAGDVAYLETQVAQIWPAGMTWRDLSGLIGAGDQQALLAMEPALGAALRRQTALRSFLAGYSSRVLRKLNRLTDRFQPSEVRPALQAIKRS